MQHSSIVGVVVLMVSGAAMPAPAQTIIDFDRFTGVVTNQFPEATFSSLAGAENVAFEPGRHNTPPNILCTRHFGAVITCILPTFIDFTDPVDNLTFWAIEANSVGVSAQFNVFENGTFSATVNLVSSGGPGNNEFVDLGLFSNVTRLEIVNIIINPYENGIGWDTFSFDVVPAPASLALLSVGALGALLRPRRVHLAGVRQADGA